jgi:hypothetical protein
VSTGKAGGFSLCAAQSGWKSIVGIGIGIAIGNRKLKADSDSRCRTLMLFERWKEFEA